MSPEPTSLLPLVDWHVHATGHRASDNPHRDPRMTVDGIIEQCRRLNFSAVGIVEHVGPHFGHPVDDIVRVAEAFHRRVADGFDRLSPQSHMKIYLGAEVDIDFAGALDIPSGLQRQLGLEYLIGSIHRLSPDAGTLSQAVEECFRRMSETVRGGEAAVIGHPWRNLSGTWGEPESDWDYDRVRASMQCEFAELLVRHGVAAEINPGSAGVSRTYRAFLARLADAKVQLAPVSDAHDYQRLGGTRQLVETLAQTGFVVRQWWSP